jgi:hypothetical protein
MSNDREGGRKNDYPAKGKMWKNSKKNMAAMT